MRLKDSVYSTLFCSVKTWAFALLMLIVTISPPANAETAEEQASQEEQNSEASGGRCEERADEIESIHGRLRALESSSGRNLGALQRDHDEKMAELTLLEGLREIRDRYQDFLQGIDDLEADNPTLNELKDYQNHLKDGMDGMRRMLVLEDMVDEILKIKDHEEVEKSIQDNGLYETLRSHCNGRLFGISIKGELKDNQLCQALDDPEEHADSPENAQAYREEMQNMIQGFSEAYGLMAEEGVLEREDIQSPQDPDKPEYAALIRSEARGLADRRRDRLDYFLEEYQDMLRQDMTYGVHPADILDETEEIDQAIGLRIEDQSSEDSPIMITDAYEDYKQCLTENALMEDTSQRRHCDLRLNPDGPDGTSSQQLQQKISEYQNRVKDHMVNGFNHFLNDYQTLEDPAYREPADHHTHQQDGPNIETDEEKYAQKKDETERLARQSKETYINPTQEDQNEYGPLLQQALEENIPIHELPQRMRQLDGNQQTQDELSRYISEQSQELLPHFQDSLKNYLEIANEMDLQFEFHEDHGSGENPGVHTADFMNEKMGELCQQNNVISSTQTGGSSQVSFNSSQLQNCLGELSDKPEALDQKIAEVNQQLENKENEINNLKEQNNRYPALHDALIVALNEFSDKCNNSQDDYNYRCVTYDTSRGEETIKAFVKQGGEIISILDSQLNPHKYEATRENVAQMHEACQDGLHNEAGLTCSKITQDHVQLQKPTEREKWAELHEDYYVTRDENGNLQREKRPTQSSMFLQALGQGLQEHAVPGYMQYQNNKMRMNYNTSWAMHNKYQQDFFETNRESFFMPMWQDMNNDPWATDLWSSRQSLMGGGTSYYGAPSATGNSYPYSNFMFSQTSQIYYN